MTSPKVTQVRISNYKVGIVGFKEALEEISEQYAGKSDDAIADELLKCLSKSNYIPENAQNMYRQAFIRELRKFLGQPFENEGSRGLEIKVLGEGCLVCDSLENKVMAVLTDMGLPADLEHVRDKEEIIEYNVRGTPALMINDKVVSVGKEPSTGQIIKWIEETGVNKKPGGSMENTVLIKNIPFSEPHNLANLVDYEEGRVVSRTFSQNSSLSLTLFAFDEGEGVSTHTAPGDALVQVLDGEALVNIDGKEMNLCAGEVVVMPADIPHSVTAVKRFKMLLTVVKKPVGIKS
jgi:quercetin dioxygenase-like cupin family protein